MFPRAVVHARELSSEPEVWYVYREGAWRPSSGPWWTAPLVPHLVLGQDGWVHHANQAAISLLGIDDAHAHHYSDFLPQGAVEDASHLFDMVGRGHVLAATLLLRPVGGDLIACEVRAEPAGDGIGAWLRLAEEVEVGPQPDRSRCPGSRHCRSTTRYSAATSAGSSPRCPIPLPTAWLFACGACSRTHA